MKCTIVNYLLCALGLTLGWLALQRNARADAQDGLYAEKSTALDGVVVRRIRDPHNDVVCYVAIGNGRGYANQPMVFPAISCVRQ